MATLLDPPKLERRTSGRLLGGVAGGIADHLRISPVAVRAAFVALAAAGGLGVIVYAVFWIVVPAVPGPDGRSEASAAEYAAAAVAGVIALASSIWTTPFGNLFVPGALGCLGAALLWRQAGNGQRERWRRLSRSSLTAPADDRWGQARLVAGAGLVVIGCGLVLAGTNLSTLGESAVAVGVTLVGIALTPGRGGCGP